MSRKATLKSLLLLILSVLILTFASEATAQAEYTERPRYIDQAIFRLYGSGAYRATVGDWRGALYDYQRAYMLNPESTEILIRLAEACYYSDKFGDAEKFALRALDQDSAAYDAYVILADVSLAMGNLVAVDTYLQLRINAVPKDYESRLKLGFVRAQRNDLPGVIEVFGNYPENLPSAAIAKFQLGLVYTQKNRNKEAILAFEKALLLNPEYIDAAENIAILNDELGNETQSIVAWGRVLELQPDHIDALKQMLSLYLQQQNYAASLILIEKLITTDPSLSEMLEQLLIQLAMRSNDYGSAAKILFDAAQRTKSETTYLQVAMVATQAKTETGILIASLEAAYKLGGRAEVGTLLARSYAMNGNEHKATSVLELIIAVDTPSVETLWLLGMVYDRLDQRDKSVEIMLRVIEIDPINAEALNYVGYTWAEEGVNLDRAEGLIRRALTIDPDNPQYIDSLGWVFYQREIFEMAKIQLEKAYHFMPNEPTVLEHLGDVYVHLSQKEDALRLYEKSLDTSESENPEFLKEKIKKIKQTLNSTEELSN
ncbi:MAG: tetratricopeptide repeat protein [Candidatus Lindowbacteria bacterium]|nr:tetratricopeptide repeat protein [Candidatus Lindowbacteria bacterium]